MTQYKQYRLAPWTAFGATVIYNPDERANFLKACKKNASFLTYIEKYNLEIEPGEKPPILTKRLSEGQFLNTPKDIQEGIWATWGDIRVSQASNDVFWGYIMIQMIREGKIQISYLASKGSGKTGQEQLEQALATSRRKKKKKDAPDYAMDTAKRILRLLPHRGPRGRRVIAADFPIGRSWWMWHLSEIVSGLLPSTSAEIRGIMSMACYKYISERIFSHKSYIGDLPILAALLSYLQEEKISGAEATDRVRKLIPEIGVISAWKALGAQTVEENKKEIKGIADKLG